MQQDKIVEEIQERFGHSASVEFFEGEVKITLDEVYEAISLKVLLELKEVLKATDILIDKGTLWDTPDREGQEGMPYSVIYITCTLL